MLRGVLSGVLPGMPLGVLLGVGGVAVAGAVALCCRLVPPPVLLRCYRRGGSVSGPITLCQVTHSEMAEREVRSGRMLTEAPNPRKREGGERTASHTGLY